MQKDLLRNIAFAVGGLALGGFVFNSRIAFGEKNDTEQAQYALAVAQAQKAAAEAETAKFAAAQGAQEATQRAQEAAAAEAIREEKRQAKEARLEAQRKQAEALAIQQQAEERARTIAAFIAPRVIAANWIDGENVATEVYEVNFDPVNNTYLIRMGMAWNGTFVSSNQYWARGIVNVQSDGSWSFAKTETSPGLKDVSGVIAMGKLSSQFARL